MLYICANPSKAIPATREFIARALSGFTVGKPSELNIFGKPKETQFAYSGYAANIESFLYATATGHRVNTSFFHVPFPESYKATCPLPIRRLVFALNSGVDLEDALNLL
jgi:hypothetical protein